MSNCSSKPGQDCAVMSSLASLNFAFNLCQSSEVTCGANGLSKIKKVLIADNGIVSTLVKAFTKIIICEIAVLKENDSMSSVTFLILACNNFCCDLVASTSLIFCDNSHSPA